MIEWICLHKGAIDSKKTRILAKTLGCSQNEALGILSRLWIWSGENVDEQGAVTDASIEDLEDVFVIGLDRRINPDEVVNALIESGWLDYEEGRIYVHDWNDWQRYHYKLIESRKKDAERKRLERANRRNGTPKKKESTPKQEKPVDKYENGFNEFWELYPRKIGKGDAYKCYNARLKDGWKPEQLKMAAEKYRDDVISKHTEAKYIKHPKTFLSATTPFVDYISISTQTAKEGDNPFQEWSE